MTGEVCSRMRQLSAWMRGTSDDGGLWAKKSSAKSTESRKSAARTIDKEIRRRTPKITKGCKEKGSRHTSTRALVVTSHTKKKRNRNTRVKRREHGIHLNDANHFDHFVDLPSNGELI